MHLCIKNWKVRFFWENPTNAISFVLDQKGWINTQSVYSAQCTVYLITTSFSAGIKIGSIFFSLYFHCANNFNVLQFDDGNQIFVC